MKISEDKKIKDSKFCIIYPILQKYYSALKNLAELDMQEDLFVNISKVDSFFSEFRNITFVMQNIFKTPEMKKYYEIKRDKYFLNETMKWFNDSRIEVIHKSPFMLEKSLLVNVYLPDKHFAVINDKFTIDNELPFSSLEITIKEFLTRVIKLPEIYFSLSLTFQENKKDTDIYKKITQGLMLMSSFIEDIISDYPCNCNKCTLIKEKIKDIYSTALHKQFCFTWDCLLSNGKIDYSTQEIIIPEGCTSNIKEILSQKSSLGKSHFYDKCSDTKSLFIRFTMLHIFMYIQQKCSLMPTFFILYKDKTFSMLLFNGSNKTTFYRIISEISELCSEQDVIAVIYVGEYCYYSIKELEKASGTISERKKAVEKSTFSSSLIEKASNEIKTILLDSEKVNDNKYLKEQIENPVTNLDWIWFKPIQEGLNLHT